MGLGAAGLGASGLGAAGLDASGLDAGGLGGGGAEPACGVPAAAAPPIASVNKTIVLRSRTLSVLLERNLAIVLAQEVQELLVVARVHVEQASHDLVVAARLFQPLADQVAHIRARDLALHVQRIHDGPERLTLFEKPSI